MFFGKRRNQRKEEAEKSRVRKQEETHKRTTQTMRVVVADRYSIMSTGDESR